MFYRLLIPIRILFLLFVAADANAGLRTLHSGSFALDITDTPIGTGLTRYSFSASTTGANPINSMIFREFAPRSVQLLPTNAQNQPLPTLFIDNNAAIPASFPGRSAGEDTQLRFASTDVLAVLQAGQPSQKLTFESSSELAGVLIFQGTQRFFSREVAQIVLPTSAGGVFTVQLGSVNSTGSGIAGEFRGATGTVLPGDTDLNGAVTFGDFQRLELGFGGAGEWRQGDFNFDGTVDQADFALLLRNFGNRLPSSPVFTLPALGEVNTPEPGIMAMIAPALLLLARRGTRRVKRA